LPEEFASGDSFFLRRVIVRFSAEMVGLYRVERDLERRVSKFGQIRSSLISGRRGIPTLTD